ncbi:phage portal protein [Lacrimispora sp. NSJ-141]|uniref:Phage portal protein n=1 Tax=Lientehia hominis TaxID=2897778 RepID=A0AAP2RJ81_9FIRM|nr:phage portal protein [Lientehia hominis]MCD2492741.1 phage portal protein [Lientehia hominis]
MDLPIFIIQELSGPYGPEMTEKLRRIVEWYNIYAAGAEFETEQEESEEFTPTRLRSRKIKRLISKQAEFMVGKTPDIKISCPNEKKTDQGKPNESDMQEYIKEVLKKNLWSDKLLKGAKDCFIGGKVALKVNVTPDKLGIMFVPADGFFYETELDDVDVLRKVVLFYCVNDSEDKTEQRWWRQRYRMDKGHCYVSESLHDGYGETVPGHEIEDRDTKLDRIPVYVIVNDGLSGDTDGESDVDTIMDEDSWYNKMRSANLDSIRKTMNHITWVSGASPKAFEKLTNTPGAVWDLQADPINQGRIPSVGTVENSFSYKEAYADTLGNISENMHDSLGIPELSLEKTQGLMTSGKGLKMLYWPLICRCEAKWTAWKPALEWLTEMVLYAADVFPNLKKIYGDFRTADHVVTIDNQYPLPEDEAEERTLDLQEVGVARSIKSYLMEWGGPDHKGLTDDEADAEIEQLIQEKRMLEDSFAGEM